MTFWDFIDRHPVQAWIGFSIVIAMLMDGVKVRWGK